MPWVSCSSRFRDISAVVAPLLVAALPTCGNRTTLSKTLPPGVPVAARNEELTDIIEWLGEPVRQVDSSLLDEWEQLASPHQPLDAPVAVPVRPRPLTGNERAFTAMVRNALFR